MKKFKDEPFVQSVIGAFLSVMETPLGDGRLEETWLHDILSVTWAHMEHARRVREKEEDKKAVIHLCVATRKLTKSEAAKEMAAELELEMLADVEDEYAGKPMLTKLRDEDGDKWADPDLEGFDPDEAELPPGVYYQEKTKTA
jgi:hypothetical protein